MITRQANRQTKRPALSPAQRANLELLLLRIEIKSRLKKTG